MHEKTAIYKSQLEAIIENPGNMQVVEQAFGQWFTDSLYWDLVRPQCRLENMRPQITFQKLQVKAIFFTNLIFYSVSGPKGLKITV